MTDPTPHPGDPSPVLELRAVDKTLVDPEPAHLVRDVSLVFHPGEFTAILGPSGCGKSSLLYLMGLLDRPTRGEVLFGDEATRDLGEGRRTRLRLTRLGFIFQFHFLLPELTAEANVALPMERLGVLSRKQATARARDLLDRLGLAGLAGRRPDRMSGGQRQRVAIARALANDPAILLCDEPTGNLDTTNTAVVIAEFQRLAHEEGRAIICVTHDAGVAEAADRRIRMLDGRVVSDDRP
ncbi:MAG: ABC transporter ATP-binding protein [Phenylobacterium sp.]